MQTDIQAGRPIYLDHHATTPVDPRVVTSVVHAMTEAFGNANSVDHIFGDNAAALIAAARDEIAALVGGDPDGIHFSAGSTESVRLAVRHAVATRPNPERPLRIAVSAVEHRAVLDAVAAAEETGDATAWWIPVDDCARIDLDALNAACANGVDLVCVMAANNEVGTINPVERVAYIATQAGARTLIDATQAAGRTEIRAAEWGITYLALSAHKMYGPKGVGALVTLPGVTLRRARGPIWGTVDGTPNVPGITGLGQACRLRRLEMADDEPRIAMMRDRLEGLLLELIPELVVNGDRANRLSHNLHVAIPGVPNDAVIARLRRQVAISTGAACSSGAQASSHVLRAMGLPDHTREGSLRIGLGKFNTEEEIERAATQIAAAVSATRKAMVSA